MNQEDNGIIIRIENSYRLGNVNIINTVININVVSLYGCWVMIVKRSPTFIMKEKWDYLIVLDACRYDYFKMHYSNYLNGKLEARLSLGSDTLEWCKKNFQGVYRDVIYISANPIINSKVPVHGFYAKKHFHTVVDVWDGGWDEEIGTVHPKKVNEYVLRILDEYPNKRLIIHYMQPHGPYLCLRKLHKHVLQQLKRIQMEKKHGSLIPRLKSFIRWRAEKILGKIFGQLLVWKFADLLRYPPTDPIEAVVRYYGIEILRRAYEENLKIVLSYVSRIINKLSGRIVVTSDHGELLGENNMFGHPSGAKIPILIIVPWLIIT